MVSPCSAFFPFFILIQSQKTKAINTVSHREELFTFVCKSARHDWFISFISFYSFDEIFQVVTSTLFQMWFDVKAF